MINALTRNFEGSPVRSAPVVPTDTMVIPEREKVEPTRDLIAEAWQKRPELVQARIDLSNRQLNIKAARNGLQPGLDLVGFYGGSSLAGVANPAVLCGTGNPFPPPLCDTTLPGAYRLRHGF